MRWRSVEWDDVMIIIFVVLCITASNLYVTY